MVDPLIPKPKLIKLSPDDYLVFEKAKKEANLTIMNTSSSTIVFKVKTSSPKTFLVSPSNGTVASNTSAALKIIFIYSEEAMAKTHKFLIQATTSEDVYTVDWSVADVEEHKILAKMVSEVPIHKEEQGRESLYADFDSKKEDKIKKNLLRNTFTATEIEKEELKLDRTHNSVKNDETLKDNKDPVKKTLTLKVSELTNSVENLKFEVSKAEALLKFSKSLDKLTIEPNGKYSLTILILAFVASFLIAFYIF
jgi:MSP (Major sperm protein) domain